MKREKGVGPSTEPRGTPEGTMLRKLYNVMKSSNLIGAADILVAVMKTYPFFTRSILH